VRAGSVAEPDGGGEGSCLCQVPVIGGGLGCEVVEEAGGGGADDGQPPALPIGVIDGDVAGCRVWAFGESDGYLFDAHDVLLGLLVPPRC